MKVDFPLITITIDASVESSVSKLTQVCIHTIIVNAYVHVFFFTEAKGF